MEEVAKDAELGLLVGHALAAGGGLGLAAVAGEALVGGHPAGALQNHVSTLGDSIHHSLTTYSTARLLSNGRNVLGLRWGAHGGQAV